MIVKATLKTFPYQTQKHTSHNQVKISEIKIKKLWLYKDVHCCTISLQCIGISKLLEVFKVFMSLQNYRK
jgi:hypothetical protein